MDKVDISLAALALAKYRLIEQAGTRTRSRYPHILAKKETELRKKLCLSPQEPVRDAKTDISIEEVEFRILRAFVVLRVVPDTKERGWLKVRSNYPDYCHDYKWPDDLTSDEINPDRLERFTPTPEEIDDMLVALGWLGKIEARTIQKKKRYQKSVWYRSFGLTMASVGKHTGKSKQSASDNYHQAILLAWRVANRETISAGKKATAGT